MLVSVLASGSNGNCCLVEKKETSVIIDAGKSCREIESRMNRLGKSLDDVNALLLTHSHIDHSLGIGPLSRKYNIPVYMANETASQCPMDIGLARTKLFSIGKEFNINDIRVMPVATSHDVHSCGFVMGNFGYFTDTGIVTNEIRSAFKNLNAVVLESNYDPDMLINGSYPHFLKRRILSDFGHLSNIDACRLIKDNAKSLSLALLGHLSANNNTAGKVREAFEAIVKGQVDCSIMSRDTESGTWDVKGSS